MTRRSNLVALVDSGFWYACLDKSDQHYKDAQTYAELILGYRYVIPWPTLYETLCTRYVRNPLLVRKFEFFLKRPNAILLDDAPYKELALETTLSGVGRGYSIVDNVLRMILEDGNVRVQCLFTFNRSDFYDICYRRDIEMI
jgi:predicted nucleic acid-binding protein